MEKNIIEKMTSDQKQKMCVAYLLSNMEKAPAESKKLFDKLVKYNESFKEISAAIDGSKNALNELFVRGDKIMGSISAIVDLIGELVGESFSEEQLNQFLAEYDPKQKISFGEEPSEG